MSYHYTPIPFVLIPLFVRTSLFHVETSNSKQITTHKEAIAIQRRHGVRTFILICIIRLTLHFSKMVS